VLVAAAAAGAVVLSLMGRWSDPEPQPSDIQKVTETARQIDEAVKLEPATAVAEEPKPANSSTDLQQTYTNRLSRETSPYLQMHAHNPVDWYPWGDEAFKKARSENKPILLSVGYAACHWCGVMERESFADPAIGEIMNRHYVSIKLDREERPDIDRVYLTFLQLTTGGSGYPMTIFLTPDLQPILGGTYFPKESKGNLPSFRSFLTQFAEAWDKDRDNVIKAANGVTESIRGFIRDQVAGSAKPDETVFRQTYDRLAAQYDKANGGFGDKPKYPQPVNFNFLLRYYARTGQRDALNMTLHSLRKIAEGGVHDHVGGGFYRYSTDARWQVPHFEKMLYDQAQLAMSYLDAFQITRDAWYAGMARDVLAYVLRDLKSPEGGFYSAQSADSLYEAGKSELGEGAFYVWQAKAIEAELGKDAAAVFNFHYGVEQAGNIPADQDIQGELKGRNVLFVRHSVAETAARFQKPGKEIETLLEAARKKLLTARSRRPQPMRDDKVLTAGNGLMISALARAAQILDDPTYARAAATNAAFLKAKLYDPKQGRLKRTYRAGQAAVDGFLDDYAFLIQGLLDLYETSFDVQWLSWAVGLQDKQDQVFWDARQGTHFATTDIDPSVLFRMRDEYDAAEPSANSIAAMNLLRLSQLTDSAERKAKAEKTFAAFSNRLSQSPDALPQLVAALDFGQSKAKQIIIAGKANAADTRAMLRLVHERYIPNKLLILADGGAGQQQIARWLPFVEFMRPRDNKATAYICEDYVCRLPTPDLQMMARILDGQEIQ
jgi:uncharacterized protein YyaL (SSP411 family)